MSQSSKVMISNTITNTIDPTLLSKISIFCKQWNNKPNTKKIYIHNIIQCFLDHNIDRLYFQNNKRKHFTSLLKKTCGIKAAATCILWNIIKKQAKNIVYLSKTNILNPEYYTDLLLHRYSDLETTNMYLQKELSFANKQIELLKYHNLKLIQICNTQQNKFNKNILGNKIFIDEDLLTFNSKLIQTEIEIQTDWEDSEQIQDKKDVFNIDCIEHGPNSASEISQ
eukprot:268996_1